MTIDPTGDLVSVIVPVYNRAELVKESLDSVARQSYRPIELIVVDDGSTDNSGEAAKEWFERLPEKTGLSFELVVQNNSGLASARNAGFRASRGDFIQFLDSDDILHPNKLEWQIKSLKNDPDKELVYSPAIVFTSPADGESVSHEGKKKGNEQSATITGLIRGVPIDALFGVYRRSVFDKAGMWREDCRIWVDREYNLRVLIACQVGFIPNVLSYYRVHVKDRISDKFPSQGVLSTLDMMQSSLSELGDASVAKENGFEALAAQCFSVGLHALSKGRRELAHKASIQGLNLKSSFRRRVKLMGLWFLSLAFLPRRVQAAIGRYGSHWASS